VRVGLFCWLPIGSTHREDGLNGDPDAGDDDDHVDCEQQPVGGSGGGEADELIDRRPERHDNTMTSGIIAGSGLRRLRMRMTAMIASDREAMSWLVVPNSGQMRSPPSPPSPWEYVSPRPMTTTSRVAGTLVIRSFTVSPISWMTKRSRRIPVSMVVAANSTAMVA